MLFLAVFLIILSLGGLVAAIAASMLSSRISREQERRHHV